MLEAIPLVLNNTLSNNQTLEGSEYEVDFEQSVSLLKMSESKTELKMKSDKQTMLDAYND